MPLALAFVASALIHAAVLLGSDWILPGLDEAEAPPTAIEAVLSRPPASAEPAPIVKPKPRPAVPPPRPQPAAVPAPVATAAAASAVPSPPPIDTPSPFVEPPAPTIEPAAPLAVPIALPGKGRVRYTITRGNAGFVIGQAVHTWEHDGLAYKLQSVTETTGLAALFKPARIVQTSRGEVTAEGLRPGEFRHERGGGLDTASFDWARRIVAYGGHEDGVAPGTQDMLSMYYQLVLLAPSAGALDMPIATGRKLETYHFEIVGEEVVALPAGERRAVRLKTRNGNDTIELWLDVGKGADRRGLPLKIRLTDRKGEIFDQLAQDIDLRETQ